MKNGILLWLVVCTSLLHSQNRATVHQGATGEGVDQKVEALLSQMTLEEKIKQMRIFHANDGIDLDENGKLHLSKTAISKINAGIAGIKNAGTELDPQQAAVLCNQLQKYVIEHNRLGIPAMFITECYNGVDAVGNTLFCRPITMAASFNPEKVQALWDVLGREARARGFHMCHSPEGDIVRDPRFGRMSETFGEDPFLTTRMLVSAIKGVQGNSKGLRSTHIGAVTKHFAGYTQVEGGKNFASMQISPRSFNDEVLPSFKAAVQEANTMGIMASHADINGIASHGNPYLIRDTLKNNWGFGGYVVSDSHDIERLHNFMKVAESFEDAAEMALRAGLDIDLYGMDGYARLIKLVDTKPELLPLIDDAVRRVLRTKYKLGLFDHPYVEVNNVKKVNRTKKSLDLALDMDLESIILLKNENGTLPISPTAYQKIAVIGPNANPKNIEAITSRVPASTVVKYAQGCGIADGEKKPPVLYTVAQDMPKIKEALRLANESDLVLLFVGGNEFTAKEAFFKNAIGDRDKLTPVGQQELLIQELKKTGKKIVLVLEHRRTLAINEFEKHADAIIDCWDLSERGEEAMAQVLFGEVNPSGKLPVTVPRGVGQLPAYYYQKHINFKKSYLFSESSPLYPFGYGLSYTEFEFSKLSLSDTLAKVGDTIEVRCVVKNKGEVKGKEVCQVYLQDPYASVMQPMRLLKGFRKVELEPGESQTLSFTITPDMMAFTNVNMQRKVEAGAFNVFVGNSSAAQYKASFRLVNE